MDNIPFIKTWESEIDLLFVEELFSSDNFRKWLLPQIWLNWDFDFLWAWKSYNWQFWECDITTNFKNNSENIMILIENKIDAPEQFEQAKRYHKSWKFLVESAQTPITKYITCLLSPEIYFQKDAPMKEYQFYISYENLLLYFENQEVTHRNDFKKMIIKNGIIRARTWYQRITDENTDNFYNFFENIANSYPHLEFKKPKEVAKSNSWIFFTPKTFSPKVRIVYKWNKWFLDLQIWDINQEIFFENYFKKIQQEWLSLHKTGKSVSIRIFTHTLPNIAEIENLEIFESQINETLQSANTLFQWYLDNLK